jgi:cellulose synthase (UDP-forming)
LDPADLAVTMTLHLSELQSSLAGLLLIVGCSMVMPAFLSPEKNWHRALLFSIAAFLSLRYFWWRITQTISPAELSWDMLFSWSFAALEGAALLSSLSAFLILSRWRERSSEADANAVWWHEDIPTVAVLIATYNEELGVLARTIAGAKGLKHPRVEVYVLDDGKRDWLQDYCHAQSVNYVRRPDNKGSKAGNINHALTILGNNKDVSDYVVVLDADFVPHTNFLERTLALFREEDVGLVQTPQHFFNADPVQHNLGLSRSYPDEQRFFFDHLQPSRDAWGIAFCCGTSSVVRWDAVQAIGGFPTDSITEDYMLTLAMQECGWRTVYLDEALTEGLAPEGLKEYVTQRARWCLGLMQIARSRLGPFSRNKLRLRDRWSVVDSVLYWLTSFPFKLAALIYPLFYWFFNVTVVNAALPDVISYFGMYFVWILFVLNFISGGLVVPIVNDVSQLLGAIPITRAAVVGLIQPKGHPFSVTAKGGDRTKIIVQWRLMRPFLILFALTLIGLSIGVFSDRFAFNEAGDGKIVILFWTVYNLATLAVTILVCVELPRAEAHLADRPQRILVRAGSRLHRVWLTELAQESARIRGIVLEPGEQVVVALRDVGEVLAIANKRLPDGVLLALQPNQQQNEALLQRLYAKGGAPGVTRTRISKLLRDAVSRISS